MNRRSLSSVLSFIGTVLFLSACDARSPARSTGASAGDSLGITPNARRIALSSPRSLEENSGAAMSLRQPGVWFTINDSGHDPVLYALDTTGRARGEWRIAGARNRDWETIALGRCPEADAAARHCIFIGEVGDNGATHPTVTIYRVEEPDAGSAQGDLPAVALSFEYEGGPRDVEAMYAGSGGTLYLIGKRRWTDAEGRPRPAPVFTIPPSAWRAGAHYVARLADSLPIVPGTAVGRQVTGASLSRDGTAVGVRTYTQLYVFRADSMSGRIIGAVPPTRCSIASLDERQGEGITWMPATGEWLLTSEGRSEPAWVVECPAPPSGP